MDEAATSFLDDLELIPRSGPGRQAKPLSAEFQRELTVEDLQIPPVQVQTAPSLVKIRDTHHALARVLSSGASESEASAITGYSLSRISILKADPQFNELLEFYRDKSIEVSVDFKKRMADVGGAALSELAERLEEKPEDFSPALLKDIVKDMADRTGHAPGKPTGPSVNINVQLGERMAEARARVAEMQAARAPKVIDHE